MNTPRGVVRASAACMVSLVPVALYQLKMIRHLPDPPCRLFDSDRITGSRMAHPYGIPDSLLGLASYATTLGLALTASGSPVIRRALAVKIALDGSVAGANSVRQVVSFRRVCSWCMATVLASAALVWSGRELLQEEL